MDTSSLRKIYVNHPSAGYQHFNYASNAISTCKYDILSFLPRFLQEQFRRYSNVFFLIIVLLQQIPDVSPTGRFTTAVPFIIILTASALKEIFEDIKRSRSDKEINNFETKILENGQWKKTKWKKVVVGSIVRIENDEFFPADLLLLSSSEKYALSYIETSNLDGETNLKIKQGLECTSEKTEIEQLSELTCEICCEQPNKNVNQFIGTLYIGAASYPLSINQILLRGARLKNTSFVNGIVLYTGHEAKLLMNSTTAPLKQSNIDIMVNGRILILFVMLVILSVISAFGSLYYEHFLLSGAYYLGFTRVSFSFLGLTKTYMYNLLTFFILYNNLIPISLQFTLEVVRFCQAYFISCDIEMYDERTDTVAVARTSNLNEELGQIKFVMCDKTGTLTRNVMKFKRCSIAGKGYGDDEADEFADFRLIADIDNQKCGDYILEFLRVMSLCHTVVAELDNENIVYRSSSPDEGALVRGAANLGFVYEMKTPSSIKIKERDVLREYVILNVLNFSSERKRMSVIVRCPDGEIKLYIKGADSVIFSRLSQESLFKDECLSHLKEYANKGYRTLCFAYRQLNEEFYGKWAKKFAEASVAIEGREYLIDKCASEIEVELLLIGVSAIEDKLQEVN
uniref:Phospholipid-transporting ATPase n=1 Tax=Syphacia muris TaxID=451379 RepID=A0A0N5AZW4_9BILA